ncbi:hypothetical protein SS50377_24679 [Spironucleus salmonicida]|uniref:Uncharacterized protein n=1 Tax=Spironucleus salmonicida TaxID=348837 RepID=V6LJD5_9EUKA|nr:hypothetical protein SS50377_24679 [Spironucleus salmonicida]|eukprot:EST44488.1 hypothetical protein SS50377_15485 [Spironucleus salmonicida]
MNYTQKSVSSALTYFRSFKYGYDSYQSVIAAFKGPKSDEAKHAQKICGLHATECGAILAAKALAPDIEDIINQEFKNNVTSIMCHDLLADGTFNCSQCITLACQVLEDFQLEPDQFVEKNWYEQVSNIEELFQNK